MTTPALVGWTRWWQGRGKPDFIATEVVGPHGVADLVAVQFDAEALRGRAAAGIGVIQDFGALRALAACRRAPRSTADLARTLGLSESGARRALRIGCEMGALEMIGTRRFKTHPAWHPAARRLVAVELKKSDWQRAIRQLWAYQGWASSAWLMLGTRPPAKAIDSLNRMGTGLGYLGQNQDTQIVLRPRAKRLSAGVASIWAGEQLLERAGFARDQTYQNVKADHARLVDAPAQPVG